MSRGELELLYARWDVFAHDHQMPPALAPNGQPWLTWLLIGGRGAGKTRAGAEWVRAQALGLAPMAAVPVTNIALIGETEHDVREVMVEGISGVLAVHRRNERPVWTPSRRRLEWSNGAVAYAFSAEDPESLRGPQFGCAWSDEMAKWRYAQATFDMLQFGLRLGSQPRQLITTTPRPTALIKRLMLEPTSVVTRAGTQANAYHLASTFLKGVLDRHIIATGATGAWVGQADAVAVYEDGAWRFLTPKLGWCAWSDADGVLLVYDGAAWTDVASGGAMPGSVSQLGINETASSPNLLTVKSNAALFSAIDTAGGGTGDMRLQISKEASGKTASVVFSDAFSGRAEFGLVGSDAFKLKVSNNGSTFVEALVVDQASGNAALPRGVAVTGVISPSQITANQNDYNPAGLASASVLNLSSDALRSVSGLAGGTEGAVVAIVNTGSQIVTLLNENASSTAANRFAVGVDVPVAGKQAALLRYDGAASRWRALARPGGRDTLVASRTYYVRTDGSDSNDGLSNASGGAFLTIQKAINMVATLDIGVCDVTIQIADGTYISSIVVTGAWLGAGTVTINGNATTPANVLLSTTGTTVTAQGGARIKLTNLKVQSSGGVGLLSQFGAVLSVGSGVVFGTCSGAHMRAVSAGFISTNSATYSIVGGASAHYQAQINSVFDAFGSVVTLSGSLAFGSAFALADRTGVISANSSSYSGGTITGTRYNASSNAVISSGGGGANFFPGSVAGSTATGGQYI